MMKKILLVLFTIALSLSSTAQWTKQSDFNGNNRFAATNFTINGDAYILGGLIESGGIYVGFDDLWKYDALNDAWVPEMGYPGGKIYAGISFVIDGIAYVGLGANENGVQNTQIWAYDGSGASWSRKADFPGSTRNYAFAFTANSKGYVGGGIDFTGGTTYLNDFYEYNPTSNTWTQKVDYPGGGQVGLTAMTIDNRGFVGMGDDGFSYSNDFYEFDTTLEVWVPVTAFPGENRSFYQTTTANGKGYLIGGEKASSVYTNQMWSYNPQDGKWEVAFDFAGTPRAYANLFFVNNTFYYGLGLIGPNDDEGSNDIWKYDISIGIEPNPNTVVTKIYPNPVRDKVQINFSKLVSNGTIQLLNVNGQLLQTWNITKSQKVVLNMEQPKGLYLLQINSREINKTVKVVVE